jgi:hypothetical protein
MSDEESMTGPKSAKRLFRMRGLTNSLLGSVTALDKTWMPSTIRVNCSVVSVRAEMYVMRRTHKSVSFARSDSDEFSHDPGRM